ncbi:hypothetical protein [Alicyclobacillus acidocaldarius]|uniref:Uncharacterized protein n=1 Tax=Alicyclobacillus acidocaldarius subsp. acidocaldarius (strain ATCC 27009 / DSM 446 / BCRC 14685 / JCM 5260 / KCTC 1825 / NBRC 15652 / NCIMB 11725 / NRRL B-14509 / 104-IA) TaxID=521098 RepID=C8WVF2_ALIAD|nr:hypothetical protein [Alicyclobacillus acidocaldarius]ACV58074.1 hypothetical protein Aaci_1036 [Alicyclobacillus acidocaldarius subsp. acidocaldarius DSM 446]
MKRYPSKRSVIVASLLASAIAMAIPTQPQIGALRHAHARALHGAIAAMAPAGIEPVEQRTEAAQQAKPRASETPAQKPRARDAGGQKPGPSKVPAQPNPGGGKPKASNPSSGSNPGQAKPNASSGAAPATPKPVPPPSPAAQGNDQPAGPESWGYTRKTAKLRIRVIDGRTKEPIEGAEVVLIETEQRFKTDAQGYTRWFDAPVIRNPKYRPMVAELHGQLGAIAYKDGYRDSIHLGIRVHEGIRQQTTIWMYKLGPADRRIEPVLYQEPYHHLWLIQLADKFRSHTQPGEGPERP